MVMSELWHCIGILFWTMQINLRCFHLYMWDKNKLVLLVTMAAERKTGNKSIAFRWVWSPHGLHEINSDTLTFHWFHTLGLNTGGRKGTTTDCMYYLIVLQLMMMDVIGLITCQGRYIQPGLRGRRKIVYGNLRHSHECDMLCLVWYVLICACPSCNSYNMLWICSMYDMLGIPISCG